MKVWHIETLANRLAALVSLLEVQVESATKGTEIISTEAAERMVYATKDKIDEILDALREGNFRS